MNVPYMIIGGRLISKNYEVQELKALTSPALWSMMFGIDGAVSYQICEIRVRIDFFIH